VAALRPDQVTPLPQRASLKLALASNNYVWLALMYALDRGYFDKAGLNIDITPITGSSAAMLPLLARGDVDISPTTPSPATFNQVTEGFDIQLIAGGPLEREGRMASVWLTVLKDKANEIKDFKDLKGHTLEGGAQGTPFDLAVLSAVKMGGLDPAKDVTITYRVRANSDLLVLAQNQAADVIAMVEPLASQAEKQGLVVRWKPIAAVAPWYESAQLAASSKSVQSNSAAVQKFLEVYVLTSREINAANGVWTDPLMQTATKWSQLDPDTIRSVGAPPLYQPNGMLSLDSLRQAQQFLVDQGAVKTPVDLQRLVNAALLDAALTRVGRAN
jgi:ABC-type nitrate/sulfonate/bicarbonate transport system substrate-binding protein